MDPVTGGIAPLIRDIRMPKGRVPENVKQLVNYYQTRKGKTEFDLYLPGSSNNGQNFSAMSKVADPVDGGPREVGTWVSALINGVRLKHNLPADKVKQLDLDTNNQVPAGRYSANVNYWFDAPNPPLGSNNFDADLTASGVEHLALPWYSRGGTAGGMDSLVNLLKDIDAV